jgi:glycerophosphoryl diester phosphodiesterase
MSHRHKGLRRVSFLVSLALVAGVFVVPEGSSSAASAATVLNIGHRGAAGLAPEHTFASYDLALKLGADYIEQDIHMTSDGVLVVTHDDTLDRTTRGPADNCTGLVGTKTFAQIETCDAGSWFNEAHPDLAKPEYVGQRVPSLEQVFQRYGTSVNYYIETKDPQESPTMEEELLRLIDMYGLHDTAASKWQVLIQSFSPASLIKIHQLDPTLPLIQLTPATPAGQGTVDLDQIASYAAGIGPTESEVTADLVQSAHDRCMAVHPYTVDDPADMSNLIGLGVDGMFTNRPDRLESVLGQNAFPASTATARSADWRIRCLSALTLPAGPGTSLRPEGTPVVDGLEVLSGSLHDHSTDSDGDTPSATIAQWLYDQRSELGIDYGIFSEHSDLFPQALNQPDQPDVWTHQAQLSANYSRDGFTLLRGFELTNDQENHLNVIGSENWVDRSKVGEAAMRMAPFYRWLSTPPQHDPTGRGFGYGGADGVGEFNHPSSKGALNFDDYAFDPAAADNMALIEIRGDQGRDGLLRSDAGWYWFALSQGWTVSPVMNWDYHDWTGDIVIQNHTPGASCGQKGYLPCQRSQILARSSSEADIMDALRARRTSASEWPDLWATLRGPNGEWQGSTVNAAPGQQITLRIDAGSTSHELTSVDIVSDSGVDPYPYFYGDNTPCDTTGCDPSAFEQSQLTPSYVEQHRRYVMSDGHATKKARIDGPPPGTVLATLLLQGHRDTATITLTVPTAASRRPDGAHFFYAIVHAGDGRVWTAPILTSGRWTPA